MVQAFRVLGLDLILVEVFRLQGTWFGVGILGFGVCSFDGLGFGVWGLG